MKLCMCFCAILAFLSPINCGDDEEAERLFGEDVKKGAEECLNDHKVEDDDYQALKKFECPQSEVGKCFMKCMLQKMEMMKEEQFCADGFLERAKGWLKHNPEKYSKVEKMMNTCKGEVENEYKPSPEDKCGVSVAVMKCFHKHEKETEKLRAILEKISKED
ncbi:hypothetical protein L9F63_012319 [Diploptera punctata]|uniref:Uncharacterized protein n=1 Tax=Diploptera punctata TaxID=6984 RepID=A0AAD8EP10_DIPPU|nr:hypothetical protein L9F63_012319 [Diploptera punctata]